MKLQEKQIVTTSELLNESKYHSIYVETSLSGSFLKVDKKDLADPEHLQGTFKIEMINYGGFGRTVHVSKLTNGYKN